jgi:hypothetical protein
LEEKTLRSHFTKTIPTKLLQLDATRVMSGITITRFQLRLESLRRRGGEKALKCTAKCTATFRYLAKWAGFKRIGEKVVHSPANANIGVTKFGMERFITRAARFTCPLCLFRSFVKRPMHFFGVLGILMILLGLASTVVIAVQKINQLKHGITGNLITNNPYFYTALTAVIIGAQFFLAGFLGELVSRSASDRNKYQIDKKTYE